MTSRSESSIPGLLLVALITGFVAAGCGDDDSPSGPAAPTPQLDANYDPGDYANVTAGIGYYDRALTFTVQRTGALHHVELRLDNYTEPGPLIVDVRRTASGVPVQDDSDVIAVTTIAVPDTSSYVSWFTADFTGSGARLVAGDVLALACRTAGYWNWYGDTDDPNPDSAVYCRSQPGGVPTWLLDTSFGLDLGFRVYVVPE